MNVNAAINIPENVDKVSVLPDNLTIVKGGIENYFWPVSHGDLFDFGQTLEHSLSKFFREYKDQEQILPYKICSKNYVTTVCACFQAELLKHRFQEQGVELDMPKDWDVWGNVFNNKAPPIPLYLDAVTNPKKSQTLFQKMLKPSNWLKAFGKVKFSKSGSPEIDGLLLGGVSEENCEQIIVSTQRLPLVSRHAQYTKKPVHLCSSSRWFHSIEDTDLKKIEDGKESLINHQIMEIIRETYQEYDLSIAEFNEKYLFSVLQSFSDLVRVHIQRLRERRDIPSILWTGSGGNIWDVMLRCEVRRRGGYVVAHDHGGGVPHLDHPEKGWVEMWSCDEFFTYSAEQVKTFESFMESWPNLDQDLPKITTIEDKSQKPVFTTLDKFLDGSEDIKKIRVFSTIYSSEEGRGLPIYPHIPYIDWQAQLLSHLHDFGYEASLKWHPDSRLMPPSQFETVLNAELIETGLEAMDDDFDLYIFDLSNTSVLQTALMTNKPVLIVDFSVMEWREDAFELFQKRCGYVKGYYEGSRMRVDPDVLREQIIEARKKCNNHEFATTYYF